MYRSSPRSSTQQLLLNSSGPFSLFPHLLMQTFFSNLASVSLSLCVSAGPQEMFLPLAVKPSFVVCDYVQTQMHLEHAVFYRS